jgi:hypothetical protein
MTDTIAHLRAALELIGTTCHNYVGEPTCVDGGGRSPYARYGADRWCDGCIARVGLSGDSFPARGTSGVEESR